MSKVIISLLSLVIILGVGPTLAQEQEPEDVESSEIIALDEDVLAEDLGVEEANILPDSPFYFLKEWGRNIQSFFTFGSVKKAELKEKFVNEKLIEVKQMVEQNKTRERVEAAIENYKNELGEMERVTERIRERAEESEEVGKFLDKFIQQQTLHQRVLQKLEEQVPAEIYEKIEQAREMHLEKFGEVMNKLEENKEQLEERLEKNIKEMSGAKEKLIQIKNRILEKAQEKEQERK